MQLWAIQSKLSQEDSTRFLVDAFQKLGLNWAAFPIRPFDHRVPDFQWDGPIVYYGSTGLIKRVSENPELRAKARLFFDSERHKPSWFGPRLGESYLNHGAQYVTVEEFLNEARHDEEVFVRPDDGSKPFAGTLDSYRNIKDLIDRARLAGALTKESLVVTNQPIDIECELRTWVVAGKVVAIVGYKTKGRVKPWYEPEGSDLWNEVSTFSATEAAKLHELEAFVLDVAVTPKGLRVVEINDIHASGFYLTEHILDVVAEVSNYVARTR